MREYALKTTFVDIEVLWYQLNIALTTVTNMKERSV